MLLKNAVLLRGMVNRRYLKSGLVRIACDSELNAS
jgi:hypothetical protein